MNLRHRTLTDWLRYERELDHLESFEDDEQTAADLAAYDFALGVN